MSAPLLIFLVRSLAIIAFAMSAEASADESLESDASLAHPTPFNSATLLRQAIAALLPTHTPKDMLERSLGDTELNLDFASGNERDRVGLSLADSELRVRLGEELQLHCEVSSRDDLNAAPELDTAPELGIDLAIRFKFQ